ncbi:mucoidy inhibitor MuiA family protein [Lewinella sp. 4G2]|uniref:mucoidy inhibitor MuiA family protein n=1 Tax=Lewinella sp. 4G2 TaxID=1803372 RepID=UPI0007B4E0CC|nr:mucoidy inhibitor MuiA family protein [Lewinella sp. 4G2]OAV46075.1 hypothetical protein A3850_017580 [Lewinella sp. 4G2]
MLRSLLSIAFTLLLCTCGSAQDTLNVNSEINMATVFLDGAQVSRKANSSVPSGRNVITFTGLTTDLDPGSIQVNSSGDDFLVLSVSHRLNFGKAGKKDPRFQIFNDQLKALDREEAEVRTKYRIAKDEEEILAQNRVVAGNENGLSAEELKATVAYQRERLTAIRLFYLDVSDQLDGIEEKRKEIGKLIAQLGKEIQIKPTAEIVVTTQADRATRSNFTLTYLVPNAGWTPHYDVRVTDISRPIDLRYRAKVHQKTGEDWSNVRLKLSTGDPSVNAVAPTLNTWRVYNGSALPTYRPTDDRSQASFGYRSVSGTVTDENGEPLIGASILVTGSAIGTVTDFDGRYQLNLPEDATTLSVSYTGYASTVKSISGNLVNVRLEEDQMMLEEVVVVGYGSTRAGSNKNRRRRNKATATASSSNMLADVVSTSAPVPVQTTRKATTVSFDIELPYTIPSDGVARDVDIQQYKLPATYTHFAIPKLEEAAFLKAAVTNYEKYELLSGDMNLFFEGTYLGQSRLDVSNTSDTLQLSLGRDPNVIVQRTATDDYRERNFFGGKISESRGYTLSVRNKKSQPINLVVQDQVPVSGDERIEVKQEISNRGKRDNNRGIITWRTELPAGQEWKATFGYTVKYAKGLRIQLE